MNEEFKNILAMSNRAALEFYPYSADQRAIYMLDGLHLSVAGHARMGEKLACFLEKL